MNTIADLKEWINAQSYETLLHGWRHAPGGDPMFTTPEPADHYKTVMARKREGVGHSGAVDTGKRVGWTPTPLPNPPSRADRSSERADFLASVLVTAVEEGVGHWARIRNYGYELNAGGTIDSLAADRVVQAGALGDIIHG